MLYAAAFLTGFLAALGVGGGMILLIYLTLFEGLDQLSAQGVNLIFFLPIATLAVYMHRKNGLINIKHLLPAIGAGIIFSAAGAIAAALIGADILRKLYGAFLIILGARELFKGKGQHQSHLSQ